MSNTEDLKRISNWLGVKWSDEQISLLGTYQEWLLAEAVQAGGIGPREAPRIFDRHVADSVAFLSLLSSAAETLVDVGSGVGLPGIPLAIARPELSVTIVDRAERRTRLASRAVRVLGIENVEIINKDVEDLSGEYDVVTFRASLRLERAVEAYHRLAEEKGEGIFAWSREGPPIDALPVDDRTILTVVSEGAGVLESPAWFLRMKRTRSE